MPDPARLVRRSMIVCRQRGLTDAEGYLLIAGIADAIIAEMLAQGQTDIGWLREVSNLAQRFYQASISLDRQADR
jgi:hypothetical protein